MSGSGEEFWRQTAAETHAKLVEAREALARSRSDQHQHYAQVRDELMRAVEEAVDFYNTIGSPHTDDLRRRAMAALSRAGGGG